MYQPSAVWLSTENSGDRWLTDKYVLLNVTDDETFKPCAECRGGRICGECPPGYPDGPYKLTVSNGPTWRDAIPHPDIEAYFGVLAEYTWYPAYPSEWSVAEHPGKAQLWVSANDPVLLGEPTWTQIRRHYPDVFVMYSGSGNLFRFSVEDVPFCYAAGIRIPDGQEAMAKALASALDSTSNHG